MVSGDVNRPTPTTGLLVSCLSPRTYGSWPPSSWNREVTESSGHEPSMKSQQSGSSPTRPSTSSISARSIPRSPISSSTAMRQTTPARPSHSSSVSSSTSRRRRVRFSTLPPYSSLRSL